MTFKVNSPDSTFSLTAALRNTLGIVLFEYALLGVILSGILRYIVNNNMRSNERTHSNNQRDDQIVEPQYALDVHFNAFHAILAELVVGQLLLAPVLLCSLSQLTALPATYALCYTATGNLLYAVATVHFSYLSFVGYNCLPFVDRAERILHYSTGIVITLYVVSVIMNFNVMTTVIGLYYDLG